MTSNLATTLMGDAGDDWMRREHPDRWDLREQPHAFVPMQPIDASCRDGCHGGCVCDRCWERKSARVHRS